MTVSLSRLEKGEKHRIQPSQKACFHYIEEGSVRFFFPLTSAPFDKGSALYVNPRKSGSVSANSDSTIISIEFDQSLVGSSSLVARRYLQPLFTSDTDFVVLSPNGAGGLVEAIESLSQRAYGFELRLLSGLFDCLSRIVYEKQASLENVNGYGDVRLERMVTYMMEHLSDQPTLDEIASAGFISTREASRIFSRVLGTSVMKHFLQLRLEEARRLLEESSMNISQIAGQTGFESVSHFSTCFRKMYATSPSAYRARFR